MLKKIIQNIAETYLLAQAKLNKTKRNTTPFDQIKTIGIVYDATLDATTLEVKAITRKLMAMGKVIYTLGFIDKKNLPLDLEPNTKEDYFCRQDLHWHNLPIKERISRFTNEPFDYLLNLSVSHQLPLISVSAQSKAKCRIGAFHKKYTSCYDIMLNEHGQKSAAELLDAYILYLYKLKND